MHPGWWGFFGLLGVLVVVGLVVSIVQGVWWFFGVIVMGSVLLGAWGLWEARLRPEWRRVVLSDAVPSDAAVRAAAVARIREELAGERGINWPSVVIIGLVVGVFVWRTGAWWGSILASALTVAATIGVLWGALGVWRLVSGWRSARAAEVEGSGADERLLDDEAAHLLATATPAAVYASHVREWWRICVAIVVLMLTMSVLTLLAGWAGLPVPRAQVEWAARAMWLWMVWPMLLMAMLLVARTDGEKRRAIRRSNKLLYGDAEGLASGHR